MTDTEPKLPEHVAIFMGGNNRWAQRKLLPSLSGHRAALKTVRAVIKRCRERNISYLTLFAFSSENWRRPADEVNGLMQLFLHALERETHKLGEGSEELIVLSVDKFSDYFIVNFF